MVKLCIKSRSLFGLSGAFGLIALLGTGTIAAERTTSDQNESRMGEQRTVAAQNPGRLQAMTPARAARSDPRVIGGMDASQTGQWEFTVNLSLDNSYRCGGVLVSPDIRGTGDDRRVAEWRSGSTRDLWIVTAAHCVYDDNGTLYTVDQIETKAGIRDLQEEVAAVFKIEQVIPHPDYAPDDNFKHDIALLQLQQPTNTGLGDAVPKSITLPDFREFQAIFRPGVRHQVNGWGIADAGVVTNFLQTADIPYLDQQDCYENYLSLYGDMPDGSFCAGWIEGGIDSCGGDSGGPIFFPGSVGADPYRNDPILTGVVSWGRGCAQPGFPGIYTSLFHHTGWIEKQVVKRQ